MPADTVAPPPSPATELTWRETRFIEEYLKNGGNATRAAIEVGCPLAGAQVQGSRMLSKVIRCGALDAAKERWASQAAISRDELLRILIGQVTASLDDFALILSDPDNREAYRDLGYRRFALEAAKKSLKNGNEVKIISNGERKAIIDDLWFKLGFDKTAGDRTRLDVLGQLLGLGSKLGRGTGTSSGPPDGEAGGTA